MLEAQLLAPPGGVLADDVVRHTLTSCLEHRLANQRVLVLIPDRTRSLPLPLLYRALVDALHRTRQLDFMVALGTHPGLSREELAQLVGLTAADEHTRYRRPGLFNHAWSDPSALATLGVMAEDEVREIAAENWHESLPRSVPIRINEAALQYDHIVILGPTFPHEVVGFSGGAKYLFPGISGAEMINATHWLGALAGVVGTIGIRDTPVRAMIHAAARRLPTPVTLIALTVTGHDLAGLFVGDLYDAWAAAAGLSAARHIRWCEQPFQRVLSCAPSMYDELWTGAKAMYKLEPAMAAGGEVVIYAPHLEVVSHVHGKYIYEIGYHTLPYFLQDWKRYQHVPLGVLAHSTHVRGSGVLENGVEKPNVRVTLASRIPAEDCARLNLGYLDPASIEPRAWQDREAEGILYVERAGEILYRVRT
jgi:nickel-dependent lactate racemase